MSNSTPQHGHIEGSIRTNGDNKGTVRMESLYVTEAADLWSALTEPVRLARWIAEVKGDLRVGGAFTAHFTSGWEGVGRVDTCEPPRRLTVTMSPGTNDETIIDAVLTGEKMGTRLVIEERGIPMPEIAKHGAGWQAHIEDLALHLGGQAALDWRSRWIELTPSYEQLTGALS